MASDNVSLDDRQPPLVLTLDLGSSSVRCGVYDSSARSVTNMEERREHSLKTGRDGSSTADPDLLLKLLFQCIDAVLDRLGPASSDIAGVGSCTFVTNVMGLDKNGCPVTPLTTYADTTSWVQADRLSAELKKNTHQRVGCTFHPSYLPSRFLLWKETDSPWFNHSFRWSSLGEYLEDTLFGVSDLSGMTYSAASWTGLLNRHTLDWDDELLNYLGMNKTCLPRLIDASTCRKGLLPEFARRWPALENVPWFTAIGDGAAANLGSAKPGIPGTLVITLGTTGAVRVITREPVSHIPEGLWCYRVDRERLLSGGALTEGGNIFAWMYESFNLGKPDEVEQAIKGMQPDSHGLTVLPLFAGERSPGWRNHARGTIHGLSLATTPLDMLRAGMESVALRLGLIFDRLLPLTDGVSATDIPVVAGGGALTASPALAQIVTDVLGRKIEVCALKETASRGIAILALEYLGISPVFDRDALSGTVYSPDRDACVIYQTARERQIQLYNFISKNDDKQEIF